MLSEPLANMSNQLSLSQTPNSHKKIGSVFGTPLVVKGRTWLPLTEVFVWAVMTFVDHRRHPDRSFSGKVFTGGLTTFVILGSEWLHNLAHAAAAHLVGKPMDRLRIQWGMPLCVYDDINDLTVSPVEHILRSLGGPVINIFSLPFWKFFKRTAPSDSTAHDVAEAGLAMNIFLSTVSLLPIPGIDGGPILKWGLVLRGRTPQKADEHVAQVNRFTAPALTAASVLLVKKKRWLPAVTCVLMAVISWLVGYKIIREKS